MRKRSQGHRVCVITSVHPAHDVRILRKECRSLAAAGFEVTLIAPADSDTVIDGVTIRAIPKRGVFGRLTRSVWTALRVAEQVNADVYHFHDPELIPIGILLGGKGKKVIYDIHEDVPQDVLSKYWLPTWSRKPIARVAGRVEKFASRFFSALIPATPHIAEAFSGINRRIVVVQNFPFLNELFAADRLWSQRRPCVAYVGNMTEVRGVVEMVEAMGLVQESLSVTLELAGDLRPATLRDRLSGLHGWKRVHELGVLDRPSVAELLGQVQAGLVVFQDIPSHREAYPTKMFEYMSAAIPVIASDFPLWRDILNRAKCGLAVDPGRPKDIAAAIEFIVTHPAEAEAMGLRGRELVMRELNWRREEQKLLAVYEELLNT
jgi:glycosyltransferase involved in cell wall biosynthesis